MSSSFIRATARANPFIAALIALGVFSPAHADRDAVRTAKRWSYQLTGDMRSTAKSNADVTVVDPDHTGSPTKLKRKPGGGKRAVLAYISIGEVDEGRAYMKNGSRKWNTGRTQGWAGNYAAKYWDVDWKRIVKSRVRKAISEGYDGVYLDRVDTYERVKAPGGSRKAMIKFVKEVADEARSQRGNSAVMVQNAEELLTDKSYVKAIDGVAKEDLYYGINHNGRRNSKGDVASSVSLLKNAKKQGKAVYVVEYLGGSAAKRAKSESSADGFVGNTQARRGLERVANDE